MCTDNTTHVLSGAMSPLHMKVRNPMASLTLWDLLSSTKLVNLLLNG